MALILASLAASEAAIGSMDNFSFGRTRKVPQTPEPEQTPEQKQWYLDRAQARRDKRAAKKKKQNES